MGRDDDIICQTIDISQGGMLISSLVDWQPDINEVCHIIPIDEDEGNVDYDGSITAIVAWSSLDHVGLNFEHDFYDIETMPSWLQKVFKD